MYEEQILIVSLWKPMKSNIYNFFSDWSQSNLNY